MGTRIDLTGQHFGRLTVLSQDTSQRCDESRWLCQCECGNQKVIRSSSLRRGLTRSCGCLNTESRRKIGQHNQKDLSNQRFGKLVALYPTSKRTNDRQVIWACQCDCGNRIEVAQGNLISGNTSSCGCLKSYGEAFLQQLLTELNVSYEKQVSFSDLADKGLLKFDFAIYKNGNIDKLIEFDGPQHYNHESKYYSETMVKHDQMKNEYCNNHHLTLLRLTKEDLENKEQLIERILL